MQRPSPMPGVPPGLESLSQIDSLLVQQNVSLTEVFIGFETNNKYIVYNASSGQQIFYAIEDTDACMRFCCGAQRSFEIKILDNMRQELMLIKREFKCCAGNMWCAGCFDCCAHEITVEAPPGNPIGYVKQTGSFWNAAYDILDENHSPLLKIRGPCCVVDGFFKLFY